MKNSRKRAQQNAQIVVSANGAYNIPTEAGIKLVRDLFEGIGVDRLRADCYFAELAFDDVSQLRDAELTEAIAVGLDYITDSVHDRSTVKDALLNRLEAQFPHRLGHFVFRVGHGYSKTWPTADTLAR